MTNEEFWRQKTLATQLLEVRHTARALEIALGLVAARPDSVAAHGVLTQALWQRGDRAAALQGARKIVALEPDNPLGWHWLALLERRPRQQRAAIEHALTLAPERADLHDCRAGVLQRQMAWAPGNLWPEVEKSARAALEINPDHLGALQHLAMRFLQARRFEAAQELLLRALELAPEDAHTLRLLAHDRKLRGQHGAEADALRESLRLRPTNPEAQRALELAQINAKNSDLLDRLYGKMFGRWPRFLPLPFSVALFYGAIRLTYGSGDWILVPAIGLGMAALFAMSFALMPYYALLPAAWLPEGLQRYGKTASGTATDEAARPTISGRRR